MCCCNSNAGSGCRKTESVQVRVANGLRAESPGRPQRSAGDGTAARVAPAAALVVHGLGPGDIDRGRGGWPSVHRTCDCRAETAAHPANAVDVLICVALCCVDVCGWMQAYEMEVTCAGITWRLRKRFKDFAWLNDTVPLPSCARRCYGLLMMTVRDCICLFMLGS